MTSNKATPKSCSCTQCRYGKASKGGKAMMKIAERAFRHAANFKVRHLLDDATPLAAPRGGYYD
jgi:hypothetical protein